MQLYFINKMLLETTINIAYIKLQALKFKMKLIVEDNIKLYH
jgi:hypothetical protein